MFELRPRLAVTNRVARLIPYGTMGNVRTAVFRLMGFGNIEPSVWFHGTPNLRGSPNMYSLLHIGAGSTVNTPCFMEVTAEIRIGERVGIGHNTVFMTGTHELGPSVGAASRRLARVLRRIADGDREAAHRVKLGPGRSLSVNGS